MFATTAPNMYAAHAQSAMSGAGDGSAAPMVVELFTSQACRLCTDVAPLMRELTSRDDILALSFSVDYWNVMGWEDTLAQPEFTQRQRDYVRTLDNTMVYTPQFVFNGVRQIKGGPRHRGRVHRALRSLADRPQTDNTACPTTQIQANWVDDEVAITLAGGTSPTHHGACALWLVGFVPGATRVPVSAGSNAGQTLRIYNAVTRLQPIDLTTHSASGQYHISAPDAPAIAVLLHDRDTQAIIATTTVERPTVGQ